MSYSISKFEKELYDCNIYEIVKIVLRIEKSKIVKKKKKKKKQKIRFLHIYYLLQDQ